VRSSVLPGVSTKLNGSDRSDETGEAKNQSFEVLPRAAKSSNAHCCDAAIMADAQRGESMKRAYVDNKQNADRRTSALTFAEPNR